MVEKEAFKRRLENVSITEKTIHEFETVYEKVVWLFKKYPQLRDSDKELLVYYHTYIDQVNWEKIGALDEVEINRMTTPETIRRVRQKIQNEYKLFLSSAEIEELRSIRQEAVKQWAVK